MPIRKSNALWNIEQKYAQKKIKNATENEVSAVEAWHLRLLKRNVVEEYKKPTNFRKKIRDAVNGQLVSEN